MESLSHYSDAELFSLISTGDQAAFRLIFRKYAPRLASFISGFTMSDQITDGILQDIFMRIWFHREKLATVGEPSDWIYTVAASVCHQSLKKLLTDNKIAQLVQYENHYGKTQIVESVAYYKLAADIKRAINQLSPDEKIVYKLSREKNKKVPEIADELSLSPNNIRNLLGNSTETVYDYLQDKVHNFL